MRRVFFRWALILSLVGLLFGCSDRSTRTLSSTNPPTRKRSDEPYALLEGSIVRTIPNGATFEIPYVWLEPKPAKNFFLSRQEIADLRQTNGFDSLIGEAKTMDSVLPLESCVAHLGDQRWNAGVVSDQVRLYITDVQIEEVVRRIQNDAIEAARRSFDRANLTSYAGDPWRKFTIEYFSAPTHAILLREIEFYVRRFEETTVMFVFLHSVGGDEYVEPVLSSFRWETTQGKKSVATGDRH